MREGDKKRGLFTQRHFDDYYLELLSLFVPFLMDGQYWFNQLKQLHKCKDFIEKSSLWNVLAQSHIFLVFELLDGQISLLKTILMTQIIPMSGHLINGLMKNKHNWVALMILRSLFLSLCKSYVWGPWSIVARKNKANSSLTVWPYLQPQISFGCGV